MDLYKILRSLKINWKIKMIIRISMFFRLKIKRPNSTLFNFSNENQKIQALHNQQNQFSLLKNGISVIIRSNHFEQKNDVGYQKNFVFIDIVYPFGLFF